MRVSLEVLDKRAARSSIRANPAVLNGAPRSDEHEGRLGVLLTLYPAQCVSLWAKRFAREEQNKLDSQ